MEDFAGGLDCNLRISGMVADSIMMGIVHSAMEHAFDKACSKEGVLERLNDKSRFCELAVMQLEWCLKFVQEETDKFFMIESSCEREKLLNDLTETRDRIQRRLEETELAIWEKDREFSERVECDFKLREAVEMKDRQLSSLRSNFEYDRSKSDSWVVGADDGRDGDFCELKNSVDKQFFNIKRKLEDERINFTFGMRKMSIDLTNVMDDEPDLQPVDEENGHSHGECLVMDDEINRPNQSLRRVFSTGFEKMGSDIDILKETLDAAFGIMSNAISLAEVGPMEQQWRWAVEKDIVFAVFKGFLQDVQGGHIPRIRDRNEYDFQLSSGVNWLHLMDEIGNLRNELDQLLVSHSEDRPKTVTPRDTVTSPPPVKNAATNKEIIFSKEKPPTDEADVSSTLNRSRSGSGKIENISPQVNDQDNPEEPGKESQAGQGSLVAEMIRNHESIIRQKSEELNWLKGEIIREKGSAVKKDKGCDTMRKRIQDLVARLDSVIEGNKNLGTNDNDCRLAHENDSIRRFSSQEVSQLNEDQEDLNLKTLMDDVNVVVLKNIVKDLHSNLRNDDRIRVIRDDVCKVFLRETVEDWKHKIASYDIESHLREEVFYFICSEALRDARDGCTCKKYLVNRNEDNKEETSSSNHSQNLESLIAEDVQTIILSETVHEWENYLESSNIETVIREEVFYIVICSAAKDITCSPSFISTEHQNTSSNGISEEDLSQNDSQDEKLESIIQGNVYMDFFREMVKEWNREVQNYNTDKWNSQSVLPFSDNMPQQLCARENDNLMRTLDSLSNCFEAEENLISLSSKMIEREAQIELFDERLVEVHHKGLLVMKDESLGSVVKNLKLILQQISMSKLQLKELRSCLGFAVGDTKGGLDQMNSVGMTAEGRKDSPHLIEKEKEAAEDPSVLSTLTIFSKAIVDFECMVQETMGLSLSRLEKLKHQLDSSVEHVTSLREQELLYRKAFIMRCCNLQKAEAEVDLLADEQDDLLLLLEKIYIALDHYSPVLQHYFGIEEILKLIREELTGTATRFQ